jgi:hypothetical protein
VRHSSFIHAEITHLYLRHDSFIHVEMTRWYLRHDSFIHADMSFSTKKPYNYWLFCEKWPAIWGILWVFATLYLRHDSFTRLLHTSDMTHSCVQHDSFIHQMWLIRLLHTSDIKSAAYIRYDSFDSFIHDSFIHDSFIHQIWLIYVCNTTPLNL